MSLALVDDHTLFVEALRNLLLKHGYTDITIFNKVIDFFSSIDKVNPDIIIVELKIKGTDGLKFLEDCNKMMNKKTKIIILSSTFDLLTVRKAIQHGASAYLSKNISLEELLDAITHVANGKQYIEISLRNGLLDSVFNQEKIVFHLSLREKDVLNMVCAGHTMKEIASLLQLSVHTAQYYHRNVMAKLKVKRTADLIVAAIQNGLYILPPNN